MNQEKNTLIEKVTKLERETGDIDPKELKSILGKILPLFRLRLFDPYLTKVYGPILVLGKVLEKEYPLTGKEVNWLIKELIKNEPEALKLVQKRGIKLFTPPSKEEAEFLEKLEIFSKSGGDLKPIVLDFLGLQKK